MSEESNGTPSELFSDAWWVEDNEWYVQCWDPAFRVQLFWVATEFPSLFAVLWYDNHYNFGLFKTIDDFAPLIRNGNSAPIWLQRITKSKNPNNPYVTLVDINSDDDDPCDQLEEFSSRYDLSDDDVQEHLFKLEEIPFILDWNQKPSDFYHTCDSSTYFYFVYRKPSAINIGVKKKSMEKYEYLLDAVLNEDLIHYFEGESSTDEFVDSAITHCRYCLPEFPDNAANVTNAFQELLDASTLTELQKEFIDNSLFEVLSRGLRWLHIDFDSTALDLLVQLLNKYPNDFPSLRGWVSEQS